MTFEMIFVTVILCFMLFFLLTGKLTPDMVSVFIVISLVFSGILTVNEAFSGFGNPAVITIASFFVISGALYHTEVSGLIGSWILRVCGSSEVKITALIMTSGIILSSFLSNLAATSLLLPGVISLSVKSRVAPSRLLLPLAYSAILGGMLTVVSTQPNIIVNAFMLEVRGEELDFFAFLPFSLVMCLSGFIYMLIIGRRLLPERDFEEKIESSTSPEKLPSIYRLDERLFELKVTSKSLIAGKTLAESRLGSGFGLNVIDILHSTRRKMSPDRDEKIMPKDRLLVQGREEDILSAAKECGMEVKRKGYSRKDDFMSDKIGIAEVVLAPRSQYAGKKLKDIYMRERFGITVLAIWRGGNPIRARLGHEILQLGDALLLRGPRKKLSMLSGTDEFLPVSGFVTPRSPQHRDRMIISVIIIALMLSAVVSRLLPLSLAALTAAALMVVTRCLTVAEAYRSIEWRVVIFLGGVIPFGDALVKTGLIDIFVRNVFAPFAGLGTLFISGMLFLVSSAIALLTSNITAAILLCPVAFSMSSQFDISPEMLLITVALGASNGFMTPVAQQPNLVVMGPGSYSVKDYLKAGAGMSAVVFLSFMIVSFYKGLSF